MNEGFKETEIGFLPKEWKLVPLKYLTKKIGSGATPRGGSQVYVDNGVSFIRSQNVHDTGFKKDLVYINNNAAEKLKNVELHTNDVLLNITGDSICRTSIIPNDVLPGRVNQHVAIIRSNEKLYHKFLFFYLCSDIAKWRLLSYDAGGTRKAITKSTIERFEIPIPKYREQLAIGDFLDSFNNKIHLNNEMNRTLEAISQTIFRHWFVHFEFPDNEGRPYKSSGGEMVDSELGKIPEGWEVKVLPEVTKIVDCLHTKKPDPTESEKILLQVYNIAENGTLNFDKIYTVSEPDYVEWTKNILLREGDCLITNAGRVGAIGQVPSRFEGGIGRNITAIRPEKISPTYLFRYLFSKHGQNQILILTDQGTILNSLNVKGIKKIKIIIPSEDVLAAFQNVARPLREKVEENIFENIYLSKIRDSLLPKLISGKIRVSIHEEANVK